MAMTGVLGADFSAFVAEGKKAEATLTGMQAGAAKTATALSNMSAGGVESTNTLRESFGQVDQVLNASGVNVGKYARGLVEISEMSGKTANELGLLATAASVFGAAMAGWKIGRAVAEFFELDDAIANTTARLMGWGDLAKETAGAKADVLALATRNAGRAITDMGEAMKINADAHAEHIAKTTDWSGVLGVAQQRVRELTAAQIADIEVMQRAGASVTQISAKHDISSLGLKLLAERQKQAGKDADEHTEALKKQAAAVEKANAAYNKLMSDVKNANQLALMEAEAAAMKQNAEQAAMFAEEDIKARIRRQEAINTQAAAEATAETQRVAANQAEIDGLLAAGEAHFQSGVVAKAAADETIKGYQGVAQQITITGDAIKEWINLMRYTAQANAILSENSLFTTTSQRQRVAAIPSFASGVDNFGGGLAYVHKGEQLVNMAPGTSVIPAGRGGGININVNVSGGGTREDGRQVGRGIKEYFKVHGIPLPGGGA